MKGRNSQQQHVNSKDVAKKRGKSLSVPDGKAGDPSHNAGSASLSSSRGPVEKKVEEQRHNKKTGDSTAIFEAFLTKDISKKKDGKQGGQLEKIVSSRRESLLEPLNSVKNESSKRLSENSPHPGSPDQARGIREPLHSDFYYKLDALTAKIRLFKEVFYTSKRDDEKRRVTTLIRERHQKLQKERDLKKKREDRLKRAQEKALQDKLGVLYSLQSSHPTALSKNNAGLGGKQAGDGNGRRGTLLGHHKQGNGPQGSDRSKDSGLKRERPLSGARSGMGTIQSPAKHLQDSFGKGSKSKKLAASVSPDQTPIFARSRKQSPRASSIGSNKDKTRNQSSPNNAQSKKAKKSLLLKASKNEGKEPNNSSRNDTILQGGDEGAGTNEDSKIETGEAKPEQTLELTSILSYTKSASSSQQLKKKFIRKRTSSFLPRVAVADHRTKNVSQMTMIQRSRTKLNPKLLGEYIEKTGLNVTNTAQAKQSSQSFQRLLPQSQAFLMAQPNRSVMFSVQSKKHLQGLAQQQLMNAGRVSADLGKVPAQNSRANRALLNRMSTEELDPYSSIATNSQSVNQDLNFSGFKNYSDQYSPGNAKARKNQMKKRFLPKIQSNVLYRERQLGLRSLDNSLNTISYQETNEPDPYHDNDQLNNQEWQRKQVGQYKIADAQKKRGPLSMSFDVSKNQDMNGQPQNTSQVEDRTQQFADASKKSHGLPDMPIASKQGAYDRAQGQRGMQDPANEDAGRQRENGEDPPLPRPPPPNYRDHNKPRLSEAAKKQYFTMQRRSMQNFDGQNEMTIEALESKFPTEDQMDKDVEAQRLLYNNVRKWKMLRQKKSYQKMFDQQRLKVRNLYDRDFELKYSDQIGCTSSQNHAKPPISFKTIDHSRSPAGSHSPEASGEYLAKSKKKIGQFQSHQILEPLGTKLAPIEASASHSAQASARGQQDTGDQQQKDLTPEMRDQIEDVLHQSPTQPRKQSKSRELKQSSTQSGIKVPKQPSKSKLQQKARYKDGNKLKQTISTNGYSNQTSEKEEKANDDPKTNQRQLIMAIEKTLDRQQAANEKLLLTSSQKIKELKKQGNNLTKEQKEEIQKDIESLNRIQDKINISRELLQKALIDDQHPVNSQSAELMQIDQMQKEQLTKLNVIREEINSKEQSKRGVSGSGQK